MRLASKISLAMSMAILLLMSVAVLSLVAVNRLVVMNRTITTRTVPALRLEVSMRDAVAALVRLRARYDVLRDRVYERLWSERAAGAADDLARLGGLLVTLEEQKQHRKVAAAFERYQRVAAIQPARNATRRQPAANLRVDRTAATRVERGLARLIDITDGVAERWQAEARLLEHRTWQAVILALPLSVLAALAGSGLLALRMTRTLRRLSSATGEIARGAFGRPLPVESHDEIGELAQAFNRMAERLSEVDRLKQDFFSHISHELRTPLTATQEATRLLRDRVAGPLEAKQARLVEIIGASTERVLRLVNRILDLARLRAGLLPLDREWIDLGQLVTRALEELGPQAEARGLTVAQNGGRSGMLVWGDEERLLEVLVNLVGNAIKFTPAGGSVRVSVIEGSDGVQITVEDSGVGIPSEALGRLFEPYWQAPGAPGGTGLGLAIVKGVVEAHGGRVRAESRPDGGSRFTVRLPRGAAA